MRKIFRKNKKAFSNYKMSETTNYKGIMDIKFIYMNNHIDIIYPACASCYNIPKNKNVDRNSRIEYIRRRVAVDHTSVTEHSNIVIEFKVPNSYLKELTKFLSFCHYLNYKCAEYDDDTTIVLLSGSIRGFRFLIMEIDQPNNIIYTMIKHQLFNHIERQYFIDLIENKVIEDSFIIYEEGVEKFRTSYPVKSKDETIVDILNFDNIQMIRAGIDPIFKMRDILDCITITINFKKMSRIITQQLVRHRNAITQESQRYVDYSEVEFNSPAKYKENLDDTKKYKTPLGECTLQELGDLLCGIYKTLREHGIDKEDARGYLPQNNQSGAVYMTFTLRTLFSFFKLRLDPHAQAEIRHYANIIYDSVLYILKENNIVNNLEEIERYLEPRVLYELDNENLYSDIDEMID